MNQVVRGAFLKDMPDEPNGLTEVTADPITAAATAIERCLAQAHEAGNQDAVRLLHAVSAILSASPRTPIASADMQL
jgi:hypothetical protein